MRAATSRDRNCGLNIAGGGVGTIGCRRWQAISLKPRFSVLVATGGEQVALAAKAATATIPTVFIIAGDPVKIGLVASLNRPGGNVTGFSLLDTLTEAKRLEVAHELVPGASLFAFLVNPNNPITEPVTRDLQAAADSLDQKLLVFGASTGHELNAAFASVSQQRAGGVLI